MPSLSVIMIVKNEAEVLAECLDSVARVADEIIVGDTGSTDDTVAIAHARGARVLDVPWTNDFAAARNATIQAATGDWLLHMDADEVLDPRGAATLRQIVDHDDGSDAVEILLANYSNDIHAWRWTPVDPADPATRGYAGCLPVALLRLFRNHRGFEYREAVHENITASVREKGGTIRGSDIVIHHYGYDCPPEVRARKARLYLNLAREKRNQFPRDLKCLYDVAEQAMACDEVAEAEAACLTALKIHPQHIESATVLASIYLGREDASAARSLLESLEASESLPPHLQIVLGVIACYEGHWEEATTRLENVVSHTPPAPLATLCLARVHDYSGDGAMARRLLQALTQSAPHLEEAHSRLQAHTLRQGGEAQFMAGDAQGALKTLVAALERDPEDALTHNDVGVVLHHLGDTARARDSFERALKLAPALEDAQENLAGLQSAEP